MHARSTTISADPGRIDDGIAWARDESMAALRDLDGFVGLSMLVDRDSGRCIATTSWESERAMRASDDAVRDLRRRAAELLGRGEPAVQEWHVAAMHRMHPAEEGSWVRALWLQGTPGSADRMAGAFRTAMVPRIEELPNASSTSLLIDRDSALASVAITYDDRASMDEARRTRGEAMRAAFAEEMGARIVEIAEFELAIHHLRVPELV